MAEHPSDCKQEDYIFLFPSANSPFKQKTETECKVTQFFLDELVAYLQGLFLKHEEASKGVNSAPSGCNLR